MNVETVTADCAAVVDALQETNTDATTALEELAQAAARHGQRGAMASYRVLNGCCGRLFEILRACVSFTHELGQVQAALLRLGATTDGDRLDRDVTAAGATFAALHARLSALTERIDEIEVDLATVRSQARSLDAASSAVARLRARLAATSTVVVRAASHGEDLDRALDA